MKIKQTALFAYNKENFSKKALTIHKYNIEYNSINFNCLLLGKKPYGNMEE